MQITKAMELVATSKLRKAKMRAEASRPFRTVLGEAISAVISSKETADTVWSRGAIGGRELYIVIAGDRGLAGGYNSNIFRLTESLSRGKESVFLPIGKKAIDYFTHRGRDIFSSLFDGRGTLVISSKIPHTNFGSKFLISDISLNFLHF